MLLRQRMKVRHVARSSIIHPFLVYCTGEEEYTGQEDKLINTGDGSVLE